MPNFDDKKRSIGIGAIPKNCCDQLKQFGGNIKLARKRRRIRQQDMAERIAVAIKTYRKIENGDPTVSIGLYLSALFVLGLHEDFSILASPENDQAGISLEKSRLPQRIRLKQDKDLGF